MRKTISKKWRRLKGRAQAGMTTCLPRFSKNPILRDYRRSAVDPEGRIQRTLAEYTSSISTPDAAISLQLARVLWYTLERQKPEVVMDLGSGYSSFLLRLYQRQRLAEGGACSVYSCDDNAFWLERTASYLHQHGLPASGLYLWDDFCKEHADLTADVILHDLGHTEERVANMARVFEMAHPRSIVFLDDIQKRPVREATQREAASFGFELYDLTGYTFDSFGRYAAMAIGCHCIA